MEIPKHVRAIYQEYRSDPLDQLLNHGADALRDMTAKWMEAEHLNACEICDNAIHVTDFCKEFRRSFADWQAAAHAALMEEI